MKKLILLILIFTFVSIEAENWVNSNVQLNNAFAIILSDSQIQRILCDKVCGVNRSTGRIKPILSSMYCECK